jgi:hypothetical protein
MISFTVKDDSQFWQAIVNALVCSFVWQTAQFDTQFSKAIFVLSAVTTVYFTYLSVIYWRLRSTLLYLQLDHENNELCFIESGGARLFSITKGSRANAFGIWLRLKSTGKDKDMFVQTKCFFARWQMNQRAFRAIHRHLIWHVNPTK